MGKTLIAISLLAVLLVPSVAMAAAVITLSSIGMLIQDIVNFLILISGLVVVGFIVAAGIKMVTAGGNDAEFSKGKQMLIHAMWGALVVFGVGIIVNTIASFANNPTQITR